VDTVDKSGNHIVRLDWLDAVGLHQNCRVLRAWWCWSSGYLPNPKSGLQVLGTSLRLSVFPCSGPPSSRGSSP
jgi:hypothetical protein